MPFCFTAIKHWLESCPLEFKLVYYRRYVDDIFIFFNSPEHLKRFQRYLNFCHVNISFTVGNEKENRVSFLNVKMLREQGKFTTSVYCKLTFSRICTQFESLLSSNNNRISMIITLLYRCFMISSDWTHLELIKLINLLKNNSYLEDFINSWFQIFLDNKHRIQEKIIRAPKRPFFVSFITLNHCQLKVRKSFKSIVNCSKLEILFKSEKRYQTFSVFITTSQVHSTKPELRFLTGSNAAHGVSEIRSGEGLWHWSRLEIRLNVFCRSAIPQK